ncbi:MAG: hypothetical protein QOE01_1498 [Actinomycetota bacterium]|nr:hypothetical protein [Actinomycetota bacterium]
MPTTLVATKCAAPAMERSTCDSAAKWTTASWPAITSETTSGSTMSPRTKVSRADSATGARFCMFPAYVRLSSTVTSASAREG